MTLAIAGNSITGSAITGLTNPTYTVVEDTPPANNAKQFVVTALGGTQTDVRAHSVSDPFTITVFKPVAPKALPNANSVTGRYPTIPRNEYLIIARKGVYIDADSTLDRAVFRGSFSIPAGADASDVVNLKAMLSAISGLMAQELVDFSDLFSTGVL